MNWPLLLFVRVENSWRHFSGSPDSASVEMVWLVPTSVFGCLIFLLLIKFGAKQMNFHARFWYNYYL